MENEPNAMRKFLAGFVLAALLLGFTVRMSHGQAATAQIKTPEIQQGSTGSMTVTLDKIPNLTGSIDVTAHADGDSNAILDFGCGIPLGGNRCDATAGVPLEAKLGKWVVSKITFRPGVGGPSRELVLHGEMSFKVIPHDAIILPDGATVSDIR